MKHTSPTAWVMAAWLVACLAPLPIRAQSQSAPQAAPPSVPQPKAQAQQSLADALKAATSQIQRGEVAAGLDVVRQLALGGYAPAQNALGLVLQTGDGVPQDRPAALEWFRRAAAQGLPEAAFNLGTVLEAGDVVRQDLPGAAQLYRRAAEQGVAIAQHALGMLYALGHGVPKDDGQAVPTSLLQVPGAGCAYRRDRL